MPRFDDLEEFYTLAFGHIVNRGYLNEINYVRFKTFDEMTADKFVREFAFVVISSGMKNQVAENIFKRYEIDGSPAVGHPGKRQAIRDVTREREKLFNELCNCADKLGFLETLPWIGPITKYHLARNMGLDCMKPDRHMIRLADTYGFNHPKEMCEHLAQKFQERIGTIDVILWRYCNLTGKYTC